MRLGLGTELPKHAGAKGHLQACLGQNLSNSNNNSSNNNNNKSNNNNNNNKNKNNSNNNNNNATNNDDDDDRQTPGKLRMIVLLIGTSSHAPPNFKNHF